MNTRYLRALCLVSEHGSIAAAARELGLAHTSIAEQIRSLEADLSAKLVERRGQRIVLTSAGQAILETARQIVSQADEMRHLAQGGRPAGRLRVGSISTALTTLIPAALQTLATSFPDIDLTVIPGTSAGLFRLLENNEIDCALVVQPPFQLPKCLDWLHLRDEPLALVTRAAIGSTDVKSILENAPFMRMDRKAWTGQIVESFLSSRNILVSELFELDAPEAIVILVSRGLGVTLLPDWGIATLNIGGLQITPVGQGRFRRTIGLLSRAGPAKALVDRFQQALTEADR